MKAKQELPAGFKEHFKLDLKSNKQMLIVNGISLGIVLIMIFVMNFFVPINTILGDGENLGDLAEKLIILAGLMFVYVILHEAVHGITMKIFGAKRLKFGFKSMYAYAGSDEYFGKIEYIVIALAPVIVWGIVFVVINAVVPASYFWFVYVLQIINVSGAAGDIYVSIRFAGLDRAVLIQDTGTSMIVYAKEKEL